MTLKDIKDRYVGPRAANYDRERVGTERWEAEQQAVSDIMQEYDYKQTRVLDCPVGTGRFFPIYSRLMCDVVGLDASKEMLAQARTYAQSYGIKVDLREGTSIALPFKDNEFDAVVCTRFLNWLSVEEVEKTMREFVRVSCGSIIVQIRLLPGANPKGQKNGAHDTDRFMALLHTLDLKVMNELLVSRGDNGSINSVMKLV